MEPSAFEFTGGTPAQEAQNKISFHSVAVHEVGHLIGLGHSDKPYSIMFANPYKSITHVVQDDIDSCRSMYGYSDVHDPLDPYVPPSTVSTRSYSIDLSEISDQTPPFLPDIDDGTELDATGITVFWFNTAANPADTIVQEVVDPEGFLAATPSMASSGANGSGGWFGITNFRRIREMPGVWTYYVSDSEGLIGSLTIDVQVALPAPNLPPDATITISENPATRATSITTNVTGDATVTTVVAKMEGQLGKPDLSEDQDRIRLHT